MILENIVPRRLLVAAPLTFGAAAQSTVMVDIEDITARGRQHEHLLQWLDENEHRRWSAFRLDKRQNEWLAGRLCAKMALAGLLEREVGGNLKTLGIDNRDDGRPYVISERRHDMKAHISISHSGQRAAATASWNRCGVDVQHCTERLLKVRERFCFEDELRLMQQCRYDGDADIDLLNLLWAAKEAIRKAYSYRYVPGFLSLTLDQVDRHRQCYIFSFTHEQLRFTTLGCRHGDYGLALCFLLPDTP